MATSNLKNKLAARQTSVSNNDEKGKSLHHNNDNTLISQKHTQRPKSSETHQSNQDYYRKREKEIEEEYEEKMDKNVDKEVEYSKESGKKSSKVLTAIFLILSAYMLFLVYGVINTNYVYNDKNEVVPERISYAAISDLKEFQTIATQYYACRSLYEKVLLLDCRYIAAENDKEALVVIGSEYYQALDTVEGLIVQINAMTVSSKYESIKSQILTWTQTYIAVYCQNMSSSIANKSTTDLNNALEYQALTSNGFQIITNNLASMGSLVSGAESDVINISSWTPSEFVREQSGGLFQ